MALDFVTVEMSESLINAIEAECSSLFNRPRDVVMIRQEFMSAIPSTFYGKVEYVLWGTLLPTLNLNHFSLLGELYNKTENGIVQQKLKSKTRKRIKKTGGCNYHTRSKHILRYTRNYIKLVGRELLPSNVYINFENCLRSILRLPVS